MLQIYLPADYKGGARGLSRRSCRWERVMHRLLLICEVVAVLILGTEFPVGQAHATILYPWCAHYLSPNGVHNCGFITWQQCFATVSGIGGTCEANPLYTAPPASTARRRGSRQH